MTRVSAALVIGAPLLVGACAAESTTPPAEVRPVRTIVVDPKPVEDDRRAVGEVRPRYESDLGFRVAGKIIARTVDVGASVKKGDLLARLDDAGLSQQAEVGGRRSRRRAGRWSKRKRRGPLPAIARQRHHDARQLRRRAQEPALGRGQGRCGQGRARPGQGPAQLLRAAGRLRRHRHGGRRRARPGRQRGPDGRSTGAARRRRTPSSRSPSRSFATAGAINGERPEIVVALLSNPGVSGRRRGARDLAGGRPGDAHLSGQGDVEESAGADALRRQRRRPREGLDHSRRRAAGQRPVRQGRQAGRVGGRSEERYAVFSSRSSSPATRPTA